MDRSDSVETLRTKKTPTTSSPAQKRLPRPDASAKVAAKAKGTTANQRKKVLDIAERRARYRSKTSMRYEEQHHVTAVMPRDYFDLNKTLTIVNEPPNKGFMHRIMACDVGETQYSYGLDHAIGAGISVPGLRYLYNNSCMCMSLMFVLYLNHYSPRKRTELVKFGREVLSMGYAFYVQHNKEEITHLCMQHVVEIFGEESRQNAQRYSLDPQAEQTLLYELIEDICVTIAGLTIGSLDRPQHLPYDQIKADYNNMSEFYRLCDSRFFRDFAPGAIVTHGIDILVPTFNFIGNDFFADVFKRCNLAIAMYCRNEKNPMVVLIKKIEGVVERIYKRLQPECAVEVVDELEQTMNMLMSQHPEISCFFSKTHVPTEYLLECTQAAHMVDVEFLRRLVHRAINVSFQRHATNPDVYEHIYGRLEQERINKNVMAQLCIEVTKCMSHAARVIHGVRDAVMFNTTPILAPILGADTPPWTLEVHIEPKGIVQRCKNMTSSYMPEVYSYENRAERIVRVSSPFTRLNLINIMVRESLSYKRTVGCIITTGNRSFCVATRNREFYLFDSHQVTRNGNAVIMHTISQNAIAEAIATHCHIANRSNDVLYNVFMQSDNFAKLAMNLLDAFNIRGEGTGARIKL